MDGSHAFLGIVMFLDVDGNKVFALTSGRGPRHRANFDTVAIGRPTVPVVENRRSRQLRMRCRVVAPVDHHSEVTGGTLLYAAFAGELPLQSRAKPRSERSEYLSLARRLGSAGHPATTAREAWFGPPDDRLRVRAAIAAGSDRAGRPMRDLRVVIGSRSLLWPGERRACGRGATVAQWTLSAR